MWRVALLILLSLAVLAALFSFLLNRGMARLAIVSAASPAAAVADESNPSTAPSDLPDDQADPDGAAGRTPLDEAPADPASEPASPFVDRAILLRSRDAVVEGGSPRLDGNAGLAALISRRTPVGPYLNHWTGPDARAHWPVDIPKPGRYAITIEYSAGYGAGGLRSVGGPFVLTIADHTIVGKLDSTRTARAFQMVDVATVDLPAGPTHLSLRPAAAPARARDFANVRGVTLFPLD